MSEFWEYLKRLDFRGLFLTPTTNGFLQFFRYLFVGGVATIVDWGILFSLTQIGLYYMVSTIFGFVGGLIVNYVLSKLLVFKASEAKVKPMVEFLSYGIIGVIGLGLTMLLMYVLTEKVRLYYMISKMIATILVLCWNYFARKLLIYKKN